MVVSGGGGGVPLPLNAAHLRDEPSSVDLLDVRRNTVFSLSLF